MKKLIEGLRKFQSNYVNTHRELLAELSVGQHPRTLFIISSDSRVDPNLITQAEIGQLFVIRNQREVETQTLSIRTRQQGDIGTMDLTDLRENLTQVIVNKTKI